MLKKILLAIINEYRNPEHAALISNAAAFIQPSIPCILHADEGVNESGVVVATIIKSISSGLQPEFFRAFNAAFAPSSLLPSPVKDF